MPGTRCQAGGRVLAPTGHSTLVQPLPRQGHTCTGSMTAPRQTRPHPGLGALTTDRASPSLGSPESSRTGYGQLVGSKWQAVAATGSAVCTRATLQGRRARQGCPQTPESREPTKAEHSRCLLSCGQKVHPSSPVLTQRTFTLRTPLRHEPPRRHRSHGVPVPRPSSPSAPAARSAAPDSRGGTEAQSREQGGRRTGMAPSDTHRCLSPKHTTREIRESSRGWRRLHPGPLDCLLKGKAMTICCSRTF